MPEKPVIIWFRRDLRLSDNPALSAAIETGRPLILLYIDETDIARKDGSAKRVWLHHSLKALSRSIKEKGASLTIRQGEAMAVLNDIVAETQSTAIFWNRRYEADRIEADINIKSKLKAKGLHVETFNGALLTEPWEVSPKSGGNYYKVFTPYWRAACQIIEPNMIDYVPYPAPETLRGHSSVLRSDALSLLPKDLDWDDKVMQGWEAGEAAAWARLEDFLESSVADYPEARDIPSNKSGTSRLSPHLSAGEISPRQIWHAARASNKNVDKFLSEIGWREFSYVLLYHNPKLASENYKAEFNAFHWRVDETALKAWQTGQTGFPFVDAGLRQLYQTGWMHNRVRMVVASFLIKHLLIDWREGEAWFWDCLVEADPASNAASWQWVAGSGADASPYFRIFNPFTQGQKFDPQGDYVRAFVPELKDLPNKYIHTPWTAPNSVLDDANICLDTDYPRPMVDHKSARERALATYKQSRQ